MYCLQFLLLSLFLFLSLAKALDESLDEKILNDVHRILRKRSVLDNVLLDDPEAKCRYGGIYAGGICHCIRGQTGDHCEHFECVHGTSLGNRFDPSSLLFNKPCLCKTDDWKGEMCDFQPVAKCGGRGEWKNDRCQCSGFYFGSECQYTSRCVEGFLRNGRCICSDGFQGNYCDQIVCKFGSRDYKNQTLTCNCPDKYVGRRCEQCRKHGPLVEPYPHCEIDPTKKKHIEDAAEHRQRVNKGMRKRLQLICICVAALIVVSFLAVVARCVHKNARLASAARSRRDTAERHRLLTNHVRLQRFEETVAHDSEEAARIEERNRRKSEPAVLRTTIKKEKIKLDNNKSPIVRKDTK